MSRGLGVAQRFVLDELQRQRDTEPGEGYFPFDWTDAWELSWRRSGRGEDARWVTFAELEAIRRALRTLALRGLIETRKAYDEERRRQTRKARLPLSVEEQEVVRERQRLEAERLTELGLDWQAVAALIRGIE